jgi:hypothetical protein
MDKEGGTAMSNRSIARWLIIGSVAGGLLGLPAWQHTAEAQSGKQRQQEQQQQPSADQKPEKKLRNETPAKAAARTTKSREVSGTVLDTKTVEVRGANTRNLVALVRTNKKKSDHLAIDLGPAKALQKANIRKGTKLAAEGPVVRIGDRQFLVAQRLRTNGGDVISVDRSAQQQHAENKTGRKRSP